jgi:hypothetical protein
MFAYGEPLSSDSPFWFAHDELLTDLLRVQIRSISELFASHPHLREFFDAPEATPQQRVSCFAVLALRELMATIYDTFAGRHEQSPSLGDDEKHALELTRNLVTTDAPSWVLEVDQVAELLPSRIYDALPEPLRRGGFKASTAAEVEIRAAARKLSNLREIQELSSKVLDQQLKRLESRWSAAIVQTREPQIRELKKRTGRRTRDKQRMIRDKLIAEIDDVAETIVEFLQLMDERNVKPQPTWSEWPKPNSWVKAYQNLRLRKLIHQDKSRALARVQRDRKR